MRLIRRFFISLFLLTISFPVSASAIGIVQPPMQPQKTDSPIIITGYMFYGWRVGYVQLFNSSNEVVDMAGWQVRYSVAGNSSEIELPILHGLLKPSGYVVIADQSILASADFIYTLEGTLLGNVASLRLVPPNTYLDHTIAVKADPTTPYWRRNISGTTGHFLGTFSAFQPGSDFVLYGRGLYEYPAATHLQITEILANSRNCAPTDTAGECRDFIKLYNPTSQAIDLSSFRLRVGYQGQASSAGNTFLLGDVIGAGEYKALAKSADDRYISLTNGGAYIWLEDMHGVKIYESTIIEYPDASAESKKGQAWAYDSSDEKWKWTSQPVARNSASIFSSLVVATTPKVTTSSLAPCKDGQYRSEETNRCRLLSSTATALAPCDDDEDRNPVTNRCRKTANLTSQLTPCREGQERNRETNRCRNVASTSPPSAAFAVEPIAETGKAFVGWWALGGVGSLAMGYGAWE